MKRIPIIPIIIFLCLYEMVFAQQEILNIWPNKIPGAIENSDYTESTDSSDNWLKTFRVTNPKLDYYPADEEISNGTAVIICPGGAYWLLAVGHEGAAVAHWFNRLGISAFVLKYRLPSNEIMNDKSVGPLQDAQEAIRMVRRNANEWGIDPDRIGIMGFSAGGHLASTASTHFDENVYEADTISARPNFSLLIYPVITMKPEFTHQGSKKNLLGENPSEEQIIRFSNELQVNEDTPPAFLVHSLNDGAVPVQNSINYAMAMKNFLIPCELHIYQHGGHGYGLGRSNDTESYWPDACENWLRVLGFL